MERHENVILFAPSRVGKAYTVIAFGYVATQSDIKTKFITIADLVLVLDVEIKQGNQDSIFSFKNDNLLNGRIHILTSQSAQSSLPKLTS